MNYKEFFKSIWIKIFIELFIICLLFAIYLIGRYLLPKQYRLKPIKFKEFIKRIAIILSSFPKKNDNLYDIFNKSKNIFENFTNFDKINGNEFLELSDVISSHNLELKNSYIFSNYVLSNIYSNAIETETLFTIDNERNIVKYTFNYKGEICEIIIIKIVRSNGESYFSDNFGHTPGFDVKKLINLIFEIYGNSVYLNVTDDTMTIEPLDISFDNDKYLPNIEIMNRLYKEIQEFKNRGYQRSYIVYGPPGTGKTTFCLEMSKRFSGKIIKFDSDFFSEIRNSVAQYLFEGLEADFIIADDIDRIEFESVTRFLFMLESIKNIQNKPALMTTVNNIENLDKAIIRPGRFDDIIEFKLPNKKERYVFIKEFLSKFNVAIDDEVCHVFSEITKGMSQAYLKEYCLQFVIEQDPTVLFSKILKRKMYLDSNIDLNIINNVNTDFTLIDIISENEEHNLCLDEN